MNAPTAIALSGGVDSLVSAHLLKKSGQDLIGLHFLNGFEPHYVPPPAPPDPQKPLWIENPARAGYGKLHSDLLEMVAGLQIPVLIFDCAAPFRKLVIDYFQETYQAGKTPNPCMVCNPRIKFGMLLAAAQKLGALKLATGHYVRTYETPDGLIHLRKGRDPQKDQAYFLARLTQDQLAASCFPLGGLHKKEVIQQARDQDLRPLAKQESQDVCFIGNKTYGTFLADTLGFKPSPGDIEDVRGNRIGRHPGLHLFTIGQRRGINCPSRAPYYVYGLDTARNVLKVGSKTDLSSKSCRVDNINWIIPPEATQMRLQTRVRYRSPAADATVSVSGSTTSAEVQFDRPQTAVTPGQGAVFYRGEEILGGGWIAAAEQ
jgi:tRNA-specific 2-thiouridylase